MSETTPETPAMAMPPRAEIDAALRMLLRAWAPNTVFPDDPPPLEADDDGEDDYDPYDGCQCAGTDEDDQPLGCNCAGGCSCLSCQYQEYARAKTCQAGPPVLGAPCTKPTRYRVVGFRLVRYWHSAVPGVVCPHPPGTECPCSDDGSYVDHGARPRTHQTLTACSPEHAQALIDRMRQVYGEPEDKPTRLRWYFEPCTYEPHDMELPAPLPALRAAADSARVCARMAVTAYADSGDTELWLRYARGDLARAIWHAAQPLNLPELDDNPDDEVPGPLQEEPSDPWDTDEDTAEGVAQ